MVYAYWCEDNLGTRVNFMDDNYVEPGHRIIHNGESYFVLDIAEEYPVSASEILEAMEDAKYWA